MTIISIVKRLFETATSVQLLDVGVSPEAVDEYLNRIKENDASAENQPCDSLEQ